jgi:hypothetical protein
VYLSGTDPAFCYLPSEDKPTVNKEQIEITLNKEPIEIEPVDPAIHLRPNTCIHFGKTYPIEMNVKVKDIGRVRASQLSRLLEYWTDEEYLWDSRQVKEPSKNIPEWLLTLKNVPNDPDQIMVQKDDEDHRSVDISDGLNNKLMGHLHSGWSISKSIVHD